MNKQYTLKNQTSKCLAFCVLVLVFSFSLNGQTVRSNENVIEVDWDVCTFYPARESVLISRARSSFVKNQMDNNVDPCSTFIVNYTGFTPQAEAAFQFAVDIWSNLLESSVPIRVDATFGPLPENVLGGAGPNGFIGLSTDGGATSSFYARPLAEALLGEETEDDGDSPSIDLSATFTSEPDIFYFNTDLNTPADKIDFVTVVLHELGHGLGILGFGRVNDRDFAGLPQIPTQGEINRSGLPSTWDRFIENGVGTSLLDFDDPSADLLIELTSNNLFSNGPIATAQNQGIKPKMYAPSPFQSGSSYSHWDDNTYPPGSPNSLMTPRVSRGEANHDPGVVTLGFMEDMGWTLCQGSLSVENFDIKSVSISPNPFKSEINIELSNGLANDYTINFFDINGREVLGKTKAVAEGTITISGLDNLEDALYFVKITNRDTGASITKKVIKN